MAVATGLELEPRRVGVATEWTRPEGPSCNSHDRKVGVNVFNKMIEARRADMIPAGPSDLPDH